MNNTVFSKLLPGSLALALSSIFIAACGQPSEQNPGPDQANSFYPAYEGLQMAFLHGDRELELQSQTLAFQAFDQHSQSYPLLIPVEVPVFANETELKPSSMATAELIEHISSIPESAQSAGGLLLKQHEINVPAGFFKLDSGLSPKLKVQLHWPQDFVIFIKPELPWQDSFSRGGQVDLTLTMGPINITRQVEFSMWRQTSSEPNVAMPLPRRIDPLEAERDTYALQVHMDIDLTPIQYELAPIFAGLPEELRLASFITLAEGVGVLSRSILMEAGGSSFIASFERDEIAVEQDLDGDLWLKSVDSFPLDPELH